ncbi:GNAT family N-acetyltransferase [Listeria riparia]|uniref:Acetyltransferase family protein n=1 Tax=Listeria riparia FSL S10-1204 TaxID=1265816 RepID=W7D3P5_9LIST|nr:GNAT family N-acetyltransferase [Listeria riparia]EUJ46594.1 acetyltransferase family protein [Listeria riparia FSL S10-1204]
MSLTLQLFQQSEAERQALINYTLTNDTFCAHPTAIINLKLSYHSVLVYAASDIVGFFILDNGEDVAIYTEQPDTILLRGYSIDTNQQGKGYAKQSLQLLSNFVKKHFSNIQTIVLAVNVRNTHAQKVYLKSGFIDTTRTVMGPRGEQYAYALHI